MPAIERAEAVIHTDPAGRFLDANETALQLLGVTLDELLTSPQDRFALEPGAARDAEEEALRQQWDGTTTLVGHGGLRRGDGVAIRVSFAFEPAASGFVLRMSRLDDPPEAPPVLLSVGDVLREWRAAERALADLEPGTPDWTRVDEQIGVLRARYQSLFVTANASE